MASSETEQRKYPRSVWFAFAVACAASSIVASLVSDNVRPDHGTLISLLVFVAIAVPGIVILFAAAMSILTSARQRRLPE